MARQNVRQQSGIFLLLHSHLQQLKCRHANNRYLVSECPKVETLETDGSFLTSYKKKIAGRGGNID
jgi:hypothetical protein